ncbi:MAG: aldo/keto reductase [Gemmataceae bacterium]|nr:aldo/keto reductase [Gemmataceae bacterium]
MGVGEFVQEGLGPTIFPVGLGTGRLASLGAGYSKKDAFQCMETAMELGINLVDTADSYGSSDCEKLLGSILKEMGQPMLVSSKAGYRFCDLPGPLGLFNQVGKKILNKFGQRQCFTPSYIKECLEGSLRRLRTGRLDFFFLHDPTESALMDDKLTETLLRARQAGDVRFLGIACSPKSAEKLRANHPLGTWVQTQINPWSGGEMNGEKWSGGNIMANHVFGGAKVSQYGESLQGIAREEGITPRQLLIGFGLQQSGVRCVLVGTGRAEHLRENVEATKKKLSERSLAALRAMTHRNL